MSDHNETRETMGDDRPQMAHGWGAGCVCGPTPGVVKNDDGSVTFTLRHHGLDGLGWTEEVAS